LKDLRRAGEVARIMRHWTERTLVDGTNIFD